MASTIVNALAGSRGPTVKPGDFLLQFEALQTGAPREKMSEADILTVCRQVHGALGGK